MAERPASVPGASPRPTYPPLLSELPTEQLAHAMAEQHRPMRLFGSGSFFRLWIAQVVSSLGDWIGLAAILAFAARIGGSSPAAAVGFTMAARMVPGFFLASVGGVLVDRWDRKRVMVVCNIGQGAVLALLPFATQLWHLIVISFVLEILTLLWSPAKEATVPNLVPPQQLTTANSLSLVAAYGTFPIGAAVFASLVKLAEHLQQYEILDVFRVSQVSLAIYLDVASYLASAVIISTLVLPGAGRKEKRTGRIDLGETFHELREGWRFIGTSPVVRSVIVGLGTGLVGGGMVVPLGPVFSEQVLGAGEAGFGLLLTSLGMGVAVGIVLLTVLQKRLPRHQIFTASVLGAGASMMAAASMSELALAMALVAVMGVCCGSVYVMGFTILHDSVEDELRGRVFATLYTLIRLCLLVALTVGPLLSNLLDKVSRNLFDDGRVDFAAAAITLPGVRLTLWLGGAIILVAGLLALFSLRRGNGRLVATPTSGVAA